ncbi:hypothetical protein L249_7688 [Ophiocordyceps polyrhachis-furcata BCC 54312]|uniref:Uncharacterized protein n=1 Tax=Ophiocordyceps polyrhachis-furcata BCC 54312 TaxID=1330021 RepID=A0A367LAF2_9HYPO|nr:hypothetical protein L249_7688 [Ophiocordyceps polyrhachis-furcata BCC 54312]
MLPNKLVGSHDRHRYNFTSDTSTTQLLPQHHPYATYTSYPLIFFLIFNYLYIFTYLLPFLLLFPDQAAWARKRKKKKGKKRKQRERADWPETNKDRKKEKENSYPYYSHYDFSNYVSRHKLQRSQLGWSSPNPSPSILSYRTAGRPTTCSDFRRAVHHGHLEGSLQRESERRRREAR